MKYLNYTMQGIVFEAVLEVLLSAFVIIIPIISGKTG